MTDVKPWEYIAELEIKVKELENFLEFKTSENTWLKEKLSRIDEMQKENEELKANQLKSFDVAVPSDEWYDMKKENEELKLSSISEYTRLSKIYGDKIDDCRKLEKENASLRESLKLAVEALDKINDVAPACYKYNSVEYEIIMIARDSLDKIKAKHGEL